MLRTVTLGLMIYFQWLDCRSNSDMAWVELKVEPWWIWPINGLIFWKRCLRSLGNPSAIEMIPRCQWKMWTFEPGVPQTFWIGNAGPSVRKLSHSYQVKNPDGSTAKRKIQKGHWWLRTEWDGIPCALLNAPLPPETMFFGGLDIHMFGMIHWACLIWGDRFLIKWYSNEIH